MTSRNLTRRWAAFLVLALGVCGPGFAVDQDEAVDIPDAGSGAGIWEGTLDVGVARLRLAFHFARDAEGNWSGQLDSPDQGALGMKLDTVDWNDGAVETGMKAIGGTFKGKLAADGQSLKGEWSQSGRSWPLVLKRVEVTTKIERPQEPQPPFPYRVEEVAFKGANDDVQLAGTLTLPAGEGPFPAAILISGSGQQDRNEEIFNHKPFWVLADSLTRRGIAVLRVDDRGIGGSTGEVAKATSQDFAADVQAEFKYLQSRKEIDARRIGLIGHSEGGLIAPMVASENYDVAFLVLLAAPSVNGEQIIYRQGELIAKALGAPEDAIKRQRSLQEVYFAIVRENLDAAAMEAKLNKAVEKAYAELSDPERAQLGDQKTALDQQIKLLQSPWFRFFLTHDPRPALAKVKCPVLTLNGENDLQVDPKQNLPVIETTFAESGNTDVTIHELKGLNHLFQTSETGSLAEYGQLTETFAPSALALIGDWVVEHTQR